MNELLNLIEILKLIKYEHELTLSIAEQETEMYNMKDVDEDIKSIKHCLDKISIGLSDANLLGLIDTLLKCDSQIMVSSKSDLFYLQFSCDQMKTELISLSEKYHGNENVIQNLELKNTKLKKELNLSNETRIRLPQNGDSSLCFSPTPISTSFKFNKSTTSYKKHRQQYTRLKVPDKIRTLYDLVMQYTVRGHYGVALPLCEQALLDIERSNGKCCNEYATILHIMANVYRDKGEYQKSIDTMLETLGIRESIFDLPKSEIIKTVNSLSVLYGLMYNWNESARYCAKCIDLKKEVYGVTDVRLTKELENMAIVCKNDKNLEEAIFYYKEACDIYKYNSLHSDELRIRRHMADCHLYLHQFTIALEHYKGIYDANYQLAISSVWGIKKPLWLIAEESEITDDQTVDSMKFNLNVWKNDDKIDENDLRDLLIKMAKIYRQLNMNKAANFLKGWPNFNILGSNNFVKSNRSSSLLQLNDETMIKDKTRRNSSLVGPRQRRFSENSRGNLSKIPKKSQDNDGDFIFPDITIYEAWTRSFIRYSNSFA